MIYVFFLVLLATSIFLATELLKKFKFLQSFTKNSERLIAWNYQPEPGAKPGMYNVVLQGSAPFRVLVGFELQIPLIRYSGLDVYGYLASDSEHRIVFSTFLGKKPVEFQFLANVDASTVSVSSSASDQALVPFETYPPHWFQKIGFFG